MLKLNEKFTDVASGLLIQPLSYQEVLDTRSQARAALKALLIDLNKSYEDFSFIIGDDKSTTTANKKAIRDYGGENRCVTDYVRSKGTVQSPDTIKALTGREFEHLLHKHGIEVAAMNNYFEEPKDQTGYRCVNMKLAVPVDKERSQFHIVELQIVADQIEAVYDQTHDYKRRAEEAEDEIARLEVERKFGGVYMSDLKRQTLLGNHLTNEEAQALETFESDLKFAEHLTTLSAEGAEQVVADFAEGSYAASGEKMSKLIERAYINDPTITDAETAEVDEFERRLAFLEKISSIPAEQGIRRIEEKRFSEKFGGVTIRDLQNKALNEEVTYEEEMALSAFKEEIKPLKRISRLNFAACSLINARAARGDEAEFDFQTLIGEEFRVKHMLTPGKEEHMDSMKFKADALAAQNLE